MLSVATPRSDYAEISPFLFAFSCTQPSADIGQTMQKFHRFCSHFHVLNRQLITVESNVRVV